MYKGAIYEDLSRAQEIHKEQYSNLGLIAMEPKGTREEVTKSQKERVMWQSTS